MDARTCWNTQAAGANGSASVSMPPWMLTASTRVAAVVCRSESTSPTVESFSQYTPYRRCGSSGVFASACSLEGSLVGSVEGLVEGSLVGSPDGSSDD